MSPRIAQTLFWLCLLGGMPAFAHGAPSAANAAPEALDTGLSRLHHPVSTRNRQAQAYFDQGMKLVFAFNHDAAMKSFQRALALDPDLAMAHWGIALALGPNINLPMDVATHKAAYAELQKAIALKAKASPVEREYIDALARRYSANAEADLAALQVAYKDAMKELSRRHPQDTDAAVLYAESLMDLHPWKLWVPATPTEGTLELVKVLEHAQVRQPDQSFPASAQSGHPRYGRAIATSPPALLFPSSSVLGRLFAAEAIRYLREAVVAEDALSYDEPPAWYLPSREALGTALLRAGDLAGAEKTFRDDLAHNPESGRSLFGLHAALVAEGRVDEAAKVQARFERAWRAADVKLDAAAL